MNRFAPLTPREIASAAIAHDTPANDGAVCIMPVPHGAPALPKTHPRRGAPSMRWAYRNADGLIYEIWRFDPPGERKQFYPLTLWRAANGRVEWRWKAPPLPRPLYGLDKLAAKPDAPVVICEGEKSADAAARVFVDHAAVTSPGGSQAASKTDWSPLAGRRVLLWPDADEPGSKYTVEVAAILSGLGCEVSIINAEALARLAPEGGNREPTKDGWDTADAIKEWQDLEALRRAAESHASLFQADQGAAGDDEFEREIARLATLPNVRYEREREAAAKKLKLRVSRLDKLIAAERAGDDEPAPGQGRKLELKEPEPWPVPVSGPELIGELEAGISRYVALPIDGAFIVALWAMHAYCYESFTCTPRLAITSPEKGCGKTTLLDVLFELVPRPLLTGSTSAAALFRTIELGQPVVLIDEADTFLGEKEELRGILNQGHRRGGQVLRTVGDDHEPRAFNVHCPAVIAMIGSLPGTLADRSISIQMRRLAPGEKVGRFRHGRTPELDEAARKAARWAADNAAAIEGRDPEIPEAIFNRAADNWEPLLAIAEAAGPEIAARARATALAACGTREDDSLSVRLLADTREVLEGTGKDELPSKALVDALVGMSDKPWCEINHGKPITQSWLARRLKDYGIRPGNIGPKKERAKGYLADEFKDAFSRYLPNPPFQSVHPPESNIINGLAENQSVHRKNGCTVGKSANPLNFNDSGGCTDQNPESGANAHVPASQSPKPENSAGVGTAGWRVRV
jgi:Protein of unknown function (DUF3631)